MVNRINTYALIFFLLGFSSFCFSQEISQVDSFTQHLTWDSVPYASKYEVVIEKQDEKGNWVAYNQYTVQENVLNLHFPVGYYHYKIIVYNVLNKAEPASAWYEFAIHKAELPIINLFSPQTIVLDDDFEGRFTVVAENTTYNTVYSLQHEDGTILYGSIENRDAETTVIGFDKYRFTEGMYRLSVSNPGGLEDSSQSVSVVRDVSQNLLLAASYAPAIFLSGGTIVPQLDVPLLPVGASMNLSYFPIEKPYGSFGLRFFAQALVLQHKVDKFEVHAHLFPMSLQFVYKHLLVEDNLFLDINIGGGVTYLHQLNVSENGKSNDSYLNALGITPVTGIALQYFVNKNLHLNIGIDYVVSFFIEDSFIQMIVPTVSGGWKF